MIRLLLLLMVLALPARAEQVVLGLSQDEVSITATFDGDDILIFGAIKREKPIPGGELDVVVTVSGPSEPITIRRKDKRAMIWVNSDAVRLASVPVFYAVASSAPLADILPTPTDKQLRISPEWAARSATLTSSVDDKTPFYDALIRLRKQTDLYQQIDGGVSVDEQTLFRSQINLPADLTEGNYRARIILLRDGSPVDVASAIIPVHKVGLERFLHRLSQEHALIYGLLALAIASLAGWLASSVFQLLRR